MTQYDTIANIYLLIYDLLRDRHPSMNRYRLYTNVQSTCESGSLEVEYALDILLDSLAISLVNP